MVISDRHKGVTSIGNARAGPRRQGRVSVGDPRRAVVGVRPMQRRGSVTYFDTAGPHRGSHREGRPPVDPPGRRVVLYASWAKRAWKGDGHPNVCA